MGSAAGERGDVEGEDDRLLSPELAESDLLTIVRPQGKVWRWLSYFYHGYPPESDGREGWPRCGCE